VTLHHLNPPEKAVVFNEQADLIQVEPEAAVPQ
jgi:hypothetical protein